MNFLLDLFESPSSFSDDPWGFARNQALHGYLVGGLGWWLLGPAIAIGYVIWECAQVVYYQAEPWDAIEDLCFVALIVCAFEFGNPWFAVFHALFLISGFLRRIN